MSLAPFDSLNLAFHVGDNPADVMKNRASLPLPVSAIQFMNQVHRDEFAVVNSTLEIDPTCDALITSTPGLAVAVLVADCIPLLLSSPEVVAAVHVGRKGLVNGITLKVIAQMRAMSASSIHAQLGASICGACYEVPVDMAEEISRMHPRALSRTKFATPALDLPGALIAELTSAGISYEASPVCTLESHDYFSYRRNSTTGRFAGIVWL